MLFSEGQSGTEEIHNENPLNNNRFLYKFEFNRWKVEFNNFHFIRFSHYIQFAKILNNMHSRF